MQGHSFYRYGLGESSPMIGNWDTLYKYFRFSQSAVPEIEDWSASNEKLFNLANLSSESDKDKLEDS